MKARDKFWIFGVRPGQDDRFIVRSRKPRIDWGSNVTPAEAAFYLDVPNMIMVNTDGIPVPPDPKPENYWTTDASKYMFTFRGMDRVIWSVGSKQYTDNEEARFVVELSKRYRNITGGFVDDLFRKFQNDPPEAAVEKCRAFLKNIRKELDKAPVHQELYVVWYTNELDFPDVTVLEPVDGITLWTANSEELPLLEERYAELEKLFPNKKKMLGIYLYDFGKFEPMDPALMELQCEVGLKLLKEGRLDGMIFECNAVMGVGFETDEWLRGWIQKVKAVEVPE